MNHPFREASAISQRTAEPVEESRQRPITLAIAGAPPAWERCRWCIQPGAPPVMDAGQEWQSEISPRFDDN